MRDCLVCGETGHESCDYFGPMFVRCSGCGFVTRDGYTMEVVNDITGVCPSCGGSALVFGQDN